MTARLIAIEGLDGSGKETQTKLLRQFLEAQGAKVGSISFPQYGEPSADLVEDYLKGGFGENAADVNAYAASSFFALDRLVSYLRKWRKEFESCDVFLADRYVTSNAIHQCSKLPESEWAAFTTWLFEYEHKYLGLPRPNHVVYLRLDLAASQKLLERRYGGDVSQRDVHERDLAYLERSRCAAEWCCSRFNWTPVECTSNNALRAREDVHKELLEKLSLEGAL